MTGIDRFIQHWRIGKAMQFIPEAAQVLDIGCADGALFRAFHPGQGSIGVDPDLRTSVSLGSAELIAGFFPEALPDGRSFDVIAMLAVLEHVPSSEQAQLARNCFQFLKPGGKLIITVPSPMVDKILVVLKWLRLARGMKAEQHYGYDVNLTPGLFESAGFSLVQSKKFQLGLNNLFIFVRPTLLV
ncbi:MAG: class I SAM-dependent methyltransferase [Silvibacterium sp.]